MKPLISVGIPVYNVELYLPKCIESVLCQTYGNLEIVLVDDGSTDGCGAICEEYARKDSRIRVIHQSNSGPSAARNTALRVFSGRYFMFVDSDDYLSPNAVTALYNAIMAGDCDISVGRHTDVYPSGAQNGFFCQWMEDGVLTKADVLARMGRHPYLPVCAWAKLYKREIFENLFYTDRKCGEDLWIFPELLCRLQSVGVTGEIVYYYYQRTGSLVRSQNEDAQRDVMQGWLQLSACLWAEGAEKSACQIFNRALRDAFGMKNRKMVLKLMDGYFTNEEKREIYKNLPWKGRLKYSCVKNPVLFWTVRIIKAYKVKKYAE